MSKVNTGSLKLIDGQRIYFGTDNDGEIYFDGTQLQVISAAGVDIRLSPGGDGILVLDGMNFPIADGTIGSVLTTNGTGQMGWGTPPGDTGVFGGGESVTNVIDYITISTPGNASDFGDLTIARFATASTSNGSSDRGLWAGGYTTVNVNTIDYVTISTPGNASDFGDTTQSRRYYGGTSNGTSDRGVFGGGFVAAPVNTIDYVTISSAANASDFGDITTSRSSAAGTSNGINNRGIFGGGAAGGVSLNVIDYITITSTGNATDFGDLIQVRHSISATSNGTNDRGIFGGGYVAGDTYKNTIDYVTISSAGNATDFGDLTLARYTTAATSNTTNERGVFGGGTSAADTDVIDYITINSVGDATDFGDLTISRHAIGATSNA